MARPRKGSAELTTSEDANLALRALLEAQVELEKLQGALDLARAEATARFEKRIDEWKAKAGDLEVQLQNWYMANAKELEKGGKRSVQLHYGVIGRRLGAPALKVLNRAWTWTSILVRLKSLYGDRFLHKPPEPKIDRDLIKKELTADELAECGLKVEQEENFYAEPDRARLAEMGVPSV